MKTVYWRERKNQTIGNQHVNTPIVVGTQEALISWPAEPAALKMDSHKE